MADTKRGPRLRGNRNEGAKAQEVRSDTARCIGIPGIQNYEVASRLYFRSITSMLERLGLPIDKLHSHPQYFTSRGSYGYTGDLPKGARLRPSKVKKVADHNDVTSHQRASGLFFPQTPVRVPL